VPSFEEVISLHSVGTVKISPDGKSVAFTVQRTDWIENRYDEEIWLSKEGNKPFRLTTIQRITVHLLFFHLMGNGFHFVGQRE